MSKFTKAVRKAVAPKIALQGPSGAGKTYSALRFARGFAGENGRIAVIDTENGSASLYANVTDFDVMNIAPKVLQNNVQHFWYNDFKEGIQAAVDGKYNFLIIDSASHIWQGVLDFKSRLDSRPGANSYTNWYAAGQQFNEVLTMILQSPIPIICCFRSKMKYDLVENEKGKNVPVQLGLEPITRNESEYEFSLIFEIGRNHHASVLKTRVDAFDDHFYSVITEETGREFRSWLEGLRQERIV